MVDWRGIVTGAIAAGAVALTGCASGQPGAAGSAASSRAAPSSPGTSGPSASGTSPAAGPGGAVQVSLSSSLPVPFTGDVVTLTVRAAADQQPVRLARATVTFGDGTTGSVTGPCTGASLPTPGTGLLLRHTYQRTGIAHPQVTLAAACGRSGRPDLAGATASLRVLPSAPAASASWPQCNRSQVAITATGTGAALGHVGVLFTLRNTSSASCRLYGYPGLLLLGDHGQALPTTVVRAVTGAYLFPRVVPHWVALAPGAVGSFDLQYGDVPMGSQATEPPAQACPAATQVEVTLPNAYDHSVVPAAMAPCSGQVIVSPVVPGSQWLAP